MPRHLFNWYFCWTFPSVKKNRASHLKCIHYFAHSHMKATDLVSQDNLRCDYQSSFWRFKETAFRCNCYWPQLLLRPWTPWSTVHEQGHHLIQVEVLLWSNNDIIILNGAVGELLVVVSHSSWGCGSLRVHSHWAQLSCSMTTPSSLLGFSFSWCMNICTSKHSVDPLSNVNVQIKNIFKNMCTLCTCVFACLWETAPRINKWTMQRHTHTYNNTKVSWHLSTVGLQILHMHLCECVNLPSVECCS